MAKDRGSIRIGPVSIFALIISLCLAVLAALSITTANAGWALAQRQASFTTDLYENEQVGQKFLMEVDGQLKEVRSGKSTLHQAMEKMKSTFAETASVKGQTISAQFHSEKGHNLAIELEIYENGTYQVKNWQTTTGDAEETDNLRLWPGVNP